MTLSVDEIPMKLKLTSLILQEQINNETSEYANEYFL